MRMWVRIGVLIGCGLLLGVLVGGKLRPKVEGQGSPGVPTKLSGTTRWRPEPKWEKYTHHGAGLSSDELADSIGEIAASDLERALELARREPFPGRRARALTAVYLKWAELDPEKAVHSLRTENLLPDDSLGVRGKVIAQIVSDQPEEWARNPPDWLGGIELAEVRRSALSQWSIVDAPAAAAFAIDLSNQGIPLPTAPLISLARSDLKAAIIQLQEVKDLGHRADGLGAMARAVGNFDNKEDASLLIETLAQAASGLSPGYMTGIEGHLIGPVVERALSQFPSLEETTLEALPPGRLRDGMYIDSILSGEFDGINSSLTELENKGVPINEDSARRFVKTWAKQGTSFNPDQIIACANEKVQMAAVRHIMAALPPGSPLPAWSGRLPESVRGSLVLEQ